MPDYAFPRELLDQPPEARLGYFKSFTIAHPLLKEADAALKQAIQEPAGWSLIFVYGPTGVGKTTLRRRVEKQLKESMMEVVRIPAWFRWPAWKRRPRIPASSVGKTITGGL